jgi:predicted dehydrogenase
MIKVGIIGLGEVAQLMHLPILSDMSTLYSIKAVADISPSLSELISKKYGVPQIYLSPFELVSDSEIDAVFILSPDQYHTEYASAALRAGKHVFIEKPAALSIDDLEKLIEKEKECPGQVVMVGYMRRFAGAFLRAKELLKENGFKVEYLRFRDIICEGQFFVSQTRPVFRATDISEELIKESSSKRRTQIDKALGENATNEQRTAYQMLTGLGCHSFSAVRELLGRPKKVKAVATAQKGQHLVVLLEYDDFIGTYELINDQSVVQFDAAIEIFQGSRKLKIKYETPYIRHQATALEVINSNKTDTSTITYGPDYRDAFVTELTEFYSCVNEKRKPKTSLEDSLVDLRLFKEIITMMERKVD